MEEIRRMVQIALSCRYIRYPWPCELATHCPLYPGCLRKHLPPLLGDVQQLLKSLPTAAQGVAIAKCVKVVSSTGIVPAYDPVTATRSWLYAADFVYILLTPQGLAKTPRLHEQHRRVEALKTVSYTSYDGFKFMPNEEPVNIKDWVAVDSEHKASPLPNGVLALPQWAIPVFEVSQL